MEYETQSKAYKRSDKDDGTSHRPQETPHNSETAHRPTREDEQQEKKTAQRQHMDQPGAVHDTPQRQHIGHPPAGKNQPLSARPHAGDSTAASPITSAGAVPVSPGDGWLGPWYFDADTLAKKWSQQRSGAVVSVLGS